MMDQRRILSVSQTHSKILWFHFRRNLCEFICPSNQRLVTRSRERQTTKISRDVLVSECPEFRGKTGGLHCGLDADSCRFNWQT
ncbi:hypothetical protein RvY_04674 [Ramazzottius varieornatus]|uniref:Uncharacterized protein n=1 Tax=Ramazzottius varieornatus TaxID=947166 RepID=A0A1D1USG7_RAMVA|nr:hypothetical protein RvY_04674 [Ramazzottius varieornatus]